MWQRQPMPKIECAHRSFNRSRTLLWPPRVTPPKLVEALSAHIAITFSVISHFSIDLMMNSANISAVSQGTSWTSRTRVWSPLSLKKRAKIDKSLMSPWLEQSKWIVMKRAILSSFANLALALGAKTPRNMAWAFDLRHLKVGSYTSLINFARSVTLENDWYDFNVWKTIDPEICFIGISS